MLSAARWVRDRLGEGRMGEERREGERGRGKQRGE